MPEAQRPQAPLKGVRVIELARILAGPWAGQLLADLGADVIKVENPDGGDDTRKWGPPFVTGQDGENLSAAYYHSCNRGKRSIAVDFSTPEGAETVRKLVGRRRRADRELQARRAEEIRPRLRQPARSSTRSLVYCSITGFGQDGPYAPRAGYDFIIQGMSGMMSITGAAGGEPQKAGVAISDIFTGLYSVIAIQAALRHAEKTGEGQHIDMALFDTQISVLGNQNLNYLVSGSAAGADGQRPYEHRALRGAAGRRTATSSWPSAMTASSANSARSSASTTCRQIRTSPPTPRASPTASRCARR